METPPENGETVGAAPPAAFADLLAIARDYGMGPHGAIRPVTIPTITHGLMNSGMQNDHVTMSDIFKHPMMILGATVGPRPAEIDAFVAGVENSIDQMKQAQLTAIAAASAVNTPSDSFIQQMEAAKEAAIAQMTTTINDAYAQLKTIGEQHPEAQPFIVQAMAEMSGAFQSAQGAVSGAYDGAVSAAQTAVTAIANAAEAAASAISSAASEVGSGIEKIFSGW